MKTTSGRCKPCGLVYVWQTGARHLLKRAWCPFCQRKLRVTAIALMAVPIQAREMPIFSDYQPNGRAR